MRDNDCLRMLPSAIYISSPGKLYNRLHSVDVLGPQIQYELKPKTEVLLLLIYDRRVKFTSIRIGDTEDEQR